MAAAFELARLAINGNDQEPDQPSSYPIGGEDHLSGLTAIGGLARPYSDIDMHSQGRSAEVEDSTDPACPLQHSHPQPPQYVYPMPAQERLRRPSCHIAPFLAKH